MFLSAGKRLNEYISHFETLSYDTKHLHAKHTRAKRAIDDEQHVHLKFTSHGEHFHLRLKRDLTTFSDNLEVAEASLPMVPECLMRSLISDSPHRGRKGEQKTDRRESHLRGKRSG